MGRRKRVGDIYRFDFDEKYHCYCQILEANDVVFFKYYSNLENDNIDDVLKKEELFRIWLDRDCMKNRNWKFCYNKELDKDKKNILNKFTNPVGSSDFFLLKNVGNTVYIKASRDQCIGLEVAAAWTEKGLIQRLNYSFFNKELPDHVKSDLPFYE